MRLYVCQEPRAGAVLLGVGHGEITLKPRTRIPEAERRLPINDIASIELESQSGGVSVGKAVLIGVATGAASMLTLLLFATAIA